MRLAAIALVLTATMVMVSSPAAAQGEEDAGCTVDLHDPTNPAIYGDCLDIDDGELVVPNVSGDCLEFDPDSEEMFPEFREGCQEDLRDASLLVPKSIDLEVDFYAPATGSCLGACTWGLGQSFGLGAHVDHEEERPVIAFYIDADTRPA